MNFLKKRQTPSRQARAVVTGAGSGIGRSFALELARRGGAVVCADINLDAARETVELIAAAGGQAHAVHCDVTQAASVKSLADALTGILWRDDAQICVKRLAKYVAAGDEPPHVEVRVREAAGKP